MAFKVTIEPNGDVLGGVAVRVTLVVACTTNNVASACRYFGRTVRRPSKPRRAADGFPAKGQSERGDRCLAGGLID